MMLMRKAKSWFTGYNSNVAGHEQGTIRYFVYNAGTPKYVAKITDVEMNNYKEIDFAIGDAHAVPPRAAQAERPRAS